MTGDAALSIFLPDDMATTRLGAWFAHHADAGTVLLLSGPIGAGKTHFCRSFLRALLGPETDVPSPTFTLVQTYEAEDVEIWHADLYRLGHPDEVIELGLEAAFSTAICLVEWPDRLGDLMPPDAISIALATEGDGRRAQIAAPGHAGLIQALQQDWMPS